MDQEFAEFPRAPRVVSSQLQVLAQLVIEGKQAFVCREPRPGRPRFQLFPLMFRPDRDESTVWVPQESMIRLDLEFRLQGSTLR